MDLLKDFNVERKRERGREEGEREGARARARVGVWSQQLFLAIDVWKDKNVKFEKARDGLWTSQLFLCVDLWKDKGKLYSAYCDSRNVTEAFIRNGLTHALSQFDAALAVEQSQWIYRVVVNPVLKQVRVPCRVSPSSQDVLM